MKKYLGTYIPIGILTGALLGLGIFVMARVYLPAFYAGGNTSPSDAEEQFGLAQRAGLGLLVPACAASCVSYQGQGCNSAANTCGQVNYGAYQCDGSCSAGGPPANPWWLGQLCFSGANECGQTNAGAYLCSGACSVGDPSNAQCPPPTVTWSGGGSGGGAGNPTVSTILVNGGATANIVWSASPATNCRVTGADGFVYNGGASGNIQSSPITATTAYTITCWVQGAHGVGPSTSRTIRVIPNPTFKEI